ncbi:MAG: hypothetical protein GY795_51495 [Desulfobacterales bacterium]|nr:hypothetical protein [Desulfobacterales bacterium]
MIYIDFEGRTPVDSDIPNWEPWTRKKWEKWLDRSAELLAELEKLNQAGKIDERNKFIDDHSTHWGKLKPWLEALSRGKCWFSEVRELYSHYDVEHYRPKKEVKSLDGSIRDGYWWLSFDYTNFRLCGNVGNRKKGGWFPLKHDSVCSTFENQCEDSEIAYLLDPIEHGDVNLIAFDEEGKVIPAPYNEISNWEKQRVKETVKRLKLNEHEPLTEARKKIWQRMSREIEMYLKAKSRCSKGSNPVAKEKVKNHLQKIRKMTRHDAELSSVAKWCILFRHDIQLIRLVA